MRILTLTTLFPNAVRPTHGVFVENRLRKLVGSGCVEARVIAPAPWFPFNTRMFGAYADFARIPPSETRHGIHVAHPRYLLAPKIGMTLAAHTLARCFERAARAEIEAGRDFDLIDAHYYYPDGVAAVAAARRLGKPVIVTARGTDVNLIPQFPRQKRMLLDAMTAADASIAVAQALKDEMARLGAAPEKIRVLRNGVDLEVFRPVDRDATRARLGVEGPVIASVGHLIERKGHHLVIEALARLPDATLLIAGDGSERGALEALAQKLGVAARVRFLGVVPHDALREVYGSADALALASSREGWPNVLLEAMACGTPVVAAPVWGAPEVVAAPEAGRLAAARTGEAFAEALAALFAAPPDRSATRTYAERFSWDATTQGQIALFEDVLAARESRAG